MIQAGQHSDKLPSLLLPRCDQALLYSHVDAIFSKFETLDVHKGIIAVHNGVSIWHRKHEGCQRVYVAPFPSRCFCDFNRMDFVFFRPPGADAEKFHPDPSHVWNGKCLLAFSFILCADDGSRCKFKCVLISTLEEYVCRDDPTSGQGLCLCGDALQFSMWCCIVYQHRAHKKVVCSGNRLFKSESRRLYELDAQLQGLMWCQWLLYWGNFQCCKQVTQALSRIQCEAEQQNVTREESVIQVRAKVMATDCILSILGLWNGPKSCEETECHQDIQFLA